MSSKSCRFVAAVFVGVFSFMLFTADAHARKRGIPFLFIINTGDVMYRVADLPQELARDPEFKGWQLGYKCSHFGILWADVACWDKELVVFQDNTYSDLPPDLRAELELQYPWSSTDRNPWTRFGILIMGGGFVGLNFLRKK